jgi:hypothetical protein
VLIYQLYEMPLYNRKSVSGRLSLTRERRMTVKYIKTLLLPGLVLVFLCGCSGPETKTTHEIKREVGGEIVHDSVTIKSSNSYEECIELRPGLVFDYEFDVSDIVNFNIHYHTEDGIEYPVEKRGVTFGKGTIDPSGHKFYTEEQENYCLMWDNLNSGPVRVSFRCVLREK